jgi:hypothetical protein
MKTYKQYIDESRKTNLFLLNKFINDEKSLEEIIENNPILGDVIDIILDEISEKQNEGDAGRWQDVDLQDIKEFIYDGIIKLAKAEGFNDVKNPDIFLNQDYNERFKYESDTYDPTENEGYNMYWYAEDIGMLIKILGIGNENG